MKSLSYSLFATSYQITEWFQRRFTPLGVGALACLLVTAIVGVDTKQTMAYQVFAFILSMLLVAVLWSWCFSDRLSLTRALPRLGTVGVKLRYSIAVENRTSKVQTGLQLKEEFADPRPTLGQFRRYLRSFSRKSRFVSLSVRYYRWLNLVKRNQGAILDKATDIPTLQPRTTNKVTVELMPTRRGTVRLRGATILRSDPLGFFNACQTVSCPQSMLILPKRYQVPQFALPGTRKAQSGTVSLASSVGDSAEFMSLRDYRPGDPLRKIHWKSWAKTDRPVVREEQAEHFVRHALVLDTFMRATSNNLEIFEEVVSVAASFACDLQTQESLLDLMFVADTAYTFTAGRSLGNTEQMLSILAGVQPCQEKSFQDLSESVIKRSKLMSGCICVLLDWDEARQMLIRYLESHRIPVLVLVVTDQEPKLSNEFARVNWLNPDNIQQSLLKLKLR